MKEKYSAFYFSLLFYNKLSRGKKKKTNNDLYRQKKQKGRVYFRK